MNDVAARIKTRIQLTTDGHKVYVNAVEDAFGADADYAILTKVYRKVQENETRYGPAKILSTTTEVIKGDPNPKYISVIVRFFIRFVWVAKPHYAGHLVTPYPASQKRLT
jgi:hypothetical protein